MKYIKWLLSAIVVLIIAALGSTFFMSEDFRVSDAQIIKATPEAVYNQIVILKNWENWSYWKGLDDKMITTYNDIPSGVGASYSWKSEKQQLGSGSLIIERTVLNEYIQSKLTFDGHGKGFSEYIIRSTPEGTELTSSMNNKTTGVFQKLMARLMMKPMMKKAFKTSADNMNAYLQAHPATSPPVSIDSTKTAIDSSKNIQI